MNKNLQNGFILGAALQGKTEAIEPQGEIEITENGTYDVSDKESAVVNIDCGSSDIDTYILGVLSFVPKGNVVEVN